MTTATRPDEPSPDLRSWADAQLELESAATPQQVRAVLLKRLRDDDFVPPARAQQAMQLLGGRPEAAERLLQHGQAAADEEERLRSVVDAFAVDFFSIPRDERRRLWQELLKLSAFAPPLLARLQGLGAGLTVTMPVIGNPDAAELAEQISELFVLRPLPRAARRQEMHRRQREDRTRWEMAARELRKVAPGVAQLAPVLIDELIGWRKRERRRRKALKVGGISTSGGSGGNTQGKSGGWSAWLFIVLVIGIVRVFSSSSSKPDYDIPTFRHFDYKPMTIPAYPPSNRNLQKILEDFRKARESSKERNLFLPQQVPASTPPEPADPHSPVKPPP